MYLDRLERCFSSEDLEEELARTPPRLFDFYDDIIRRVPEEQISMVEKMLRWLVHSPVRLSRREISAALSVSISHDAKDSKIRVSENRLSNICVLVNSCRGLVRFVDYPVKNRVSRGQHSEEETDDSLTFANLSLQDGTQPKIIQLSHASVREYLSLVHDRIGLGRGRSLLSPESNAFLAESCLAYLIQNLATKSNVGRSAFTKADDFLSHAALYWSKSMLTLWMEFLLTIGRTLRRTSGHRASMASAAKALCTVSGI